jgi:hypothetical protein
MTKDEFLTFLEQGRKIDEVLLLYSEHLKNTLYLSGFDKNLRNKTKETLNTLHRESYEHKIFMRQLIDQVKKGDKNVY